MSINEETSNYEERLNKVVKSCDTVGKVLRIAGIVTMVLTAAAFISAIVMLFNAGRLDAAIKESGLQNTSLFAFLPDDVELHSDIASMQEFLNDHNYIYAFYATLQTVILGCIFLTSTLLLEAFARVLNLVKEAGTPFDEAVSQKLKKCFILLAVILFLTTNTMTGVVAALILWCIYNIFSYGCELQRQSDETL